MALLENTQDQSPANVVKCAPFLGEFDFSAPFWSPRGLMTPSSTCRAFRASRTPSVGVSSSLLLGLLLTSVGIIRMPTAAG